MKRFFSTGPRSITQSSFVPSSLASVHRFVVIPHIIYGNDSGKKPLAAHFSSKHHHHPHEGPLAAYNKIVSEQKIKDDPAQRRALQHLQHLFDQLKTHPPAEQQQHTAAPQKVEDPPSSSWWNVSTPPQQKNKQRECAVDTSIAAFSILSHLSLFLS